jgi:glucosamine-6-phosphate deaminase
MKIEISPTSAECGKRAAEAAARLLKEALATKERARFVAATGASQFDMLDHLCRTSGIDWHRTEMFHLDEYIGLGPDHPASFRKYLQERLVNLVHPGTVHLVRGDAPDAGEEAKRLGKLIADEAVDVAFVGIGENGHLAFNDPPADFDTEDPYLVIELDQACRRQQVGEGWFRSLDEVPPRALSMSIRQIMKSQAIVCTVPDRRKAEAVRDCLAPSAGVSPAHPASILKSHPRVFVFLDQDSSSLL